MDLSRLGILKEKLVQSKEFSAVWTYFFDHFGASPEFHALGERTESPLLESLLAEISKGLFGKPVPATDFLLTYLPEHQFIHGACMLGGRLTNILYFEDLQMGVLAVVMSPRPTDTKMIRFTARQVPPHYNPPPN